MDPFAIVRGVCRDCDQITSGRCWRHASVAYVVGTVVIVPNKIVDVPIIHPIDIIPVEVL